MRNNLHCIETSRGPVAYRKMGSGGTDALVFIHGAVGDSRLYRHQLKGLSHNRMVVAIDLPGHGYSRRTEVPTIDDFVDAIVSVCLTEGITRPILCGHSMGGAVVLEAVRRRPITIGALVLISTAAVLPVSTELERLLAYDDMEPIADLLVGSVFSEKVELLTGFARKGLALLDPAFIRNDVVLCRQVDNRDMLSSVDMPALVVANRGDAVIPWHLTAELAEGIPGASFILNEASGHVPFFEQYHWFNRLLSDYVSTRMPVAVESSMRAGRMT